MELAGSAAVKQMAKAIWEDGDSEPALHDLADTIAESENVLPHLRAARIALIKRERMIDATVGGVQEILPGSGQAAPRPQLRSDVDAFQRALPE